MLFLLSRLLNFLIAPITWIAISIFFSIFKKDRVVKSKWSICSLSLLLFFSNTFVFDRFMHAWEINAMKDDELNHFDAAILLTGMATFDPATNRLEFNDRTDRLMQAIRLYKENKIGTLILCGGPVTVSGSDTLEPELLKTYIEALGIPETHILIESKSRNTHENAVNMKRLLDSNLPNGKYLLISSAAHLTRATMCFAKEGIQVSPYSTDRYSGPVKYDIDYLLLPSSATLFNWEKLLHEWVGILVYKLQGFV
jgi:uncharacterized SAM-binding protein YcdF (DUF218 family)